ncbi:MAG: triosephosphate isomerase [Firmicutes bacterium]|nr:triosephosphate isomerase [Bacillota bacterium]
MHMIFVNLKRFDVPRTLGGVCPSEEPDVWIDEILSECVELGLGSRTDLKVIFLLPEGLLVTASRRLEALPQGKTQGIACGCQGVYREDVTPGGNFGAFTTHLPAKAARNLGANWAIIGHSEERKDKLELIGRLESRTEGISEAELARWAGEIVDEIINKEAIMALAAGMDVLLCVGETASQRGEGDFGQQQPRIEAVLKKQLVSGLRGVKKWLPHRQVVVGYEPIWAIGPGKTPPGQAYIAWVSKTIKKIVAQEFGLDIPVVYGGGLKEDNAGAIGSIGTIDGGLVALTRFTGQIGFEPNDLAAIVQEFLTARRLI